jgi:dephospho-CoA kinase
MHRIAIAGGIGSGKTAVTDYLASRGVEVVDADRVARDVVAPGTAAYGQILDAFGTGVLSDDRNLNRALIADVVFRDPAALQRLNRITHVAIGMEILSRCERSTSAIVAIALPLFRPEHRNIFALDAAWLVSASPEVVLHRLTTSRAMDEGDARRRIDAQLPLALPFDAYDAVIDNSGELGDTFRAVDALLAGLG